MSEVSPIDRVLDLARWAPSGDNSQPWKFEVVDSRHVIIHGSDTRRHCVYDLDGRPSQMSIGALLETAAIAASADGLAMQAVRRIDMPETSPTFDLYFDQDAGVHQSDLFDFIATRSVQRRPFSTRPLSAEHKTCLQASLGPSLSIRWLEGVGARMAAAGLLFRSARLRLVTPEAYRVHRQVIHWDARFSEDRVPDQALGVGRAMLAMMRFGMHSWERVHFLNRFLAGTWAPRLLMDARPAIACAAHFVLLGEHPPASLDQNVQAGRELQRFWLTATRLGLMMQPELTPLIFARYALEGRHFSVVAGADDAARSVARRLAKLAGADCVTHGAFFGRIGYAPSPVARSLRKPLKALMAHRKPS